MKGCYRRLLQARSAPFQFAREYSKREGKTTEAVLGKAQCASAKCIPYLLGCEGDHFLTRRA
jgi:hypothetical protein